MMPAGRYYIGDLCYVLHERWDEFCGITIVDRHCQHGEFQFKDGTRFATYGTKWGDGFYTDEQGRGYGVDAGLIGCVRMDDLATDNPENVPALGHVVDFPVPFETGRTLGGTIYFGPVRIDTDPQGEEGKE